MAAGTTVTIVPCGAMTADLTWLLLAPGWAMRSRQDKDKPAEWVDVPTHTVLVDTPDGKLLWDTSCPRDWETRWVPTGLQEFFPYDKVYRRGVPRLAARASSGYRSAYRLRGPVPPAFRPRRQHADVPGHRRQADLQRQGEGVRLRLRGAFNGAHLKADYEGLEFDTVSGDTEFLPGVTFIETPGHTPGTHVDAGRPARYRNHDLHFGRGLHGRLLRPAGHRRRDRQRPRPWYTSVEKIRGIAEKSDATVVFGHDPGADRSLRLAPEGSYT